MQSMRIFFTCLFLIVPLACGLAEDSWNASGTNNSTEKYSVAPSQAPTAPPLVVSQDYELVFESDTVEFSSFWTSSSNNTTSFGDGISQNFSNYMVNLSVHFLERGLINEDARENINIWCSLHNWDQTRRANATTEYRFNYTMTYISYITDIQSLENFYFHISVLTYPDQKQELANHINAWYNVTDVTVIGVSKSGTTSAPTMQPSPAIPWTSIGYYELRFNSRDMAQPELVFANTTLLCNLIKSFSYDMSLSKFYHQAYLVETVCSACGPYVSEDTDAIDSSVIWYRNLIPAEFNEEEDKQQDELDDRQRSLQQQQPSNGNETNTGSYDGDFNFSSTRNWEVSFDVLMAWTSFSYQNVTEYAEEFGQYVRENDAAGLPLPALLETFYQANDQLGNVKFNRRQNLPPCVDAITSTQSSFPSMAPSVSPTATTNSSTLADPTNFTTVAPTTNDTILREPPAESSATSRETPVSDGLLSGDSSNSETTIVIIAVVIVILVVLCAAAFLVWFHLQKMQAKLDHAISKEQRSDTTPPSIVQPDSFPTVDGTQSGTNAPIAASSATNRGGAALSSTTTTSEQSTSVPTPSQDVQHTSAEDAATGVAAGGVIDTESANIPQEVSSVTSDPVATHQAATTLTTQASGGEAAEPPATSDSDVHQSAPTSRIKESGKAAGPIVKSDLHVHQSGPTSTMNASGVMGEAEPAVVASHRSSGISDTSQGFMLPIMSVQNLDNSASYLDLENHQQQTFFPFLPDVEEGSSRGLTLGADEFELYKDHKLEQMRKNIKENVTGLDDMMSQAMTKALIDQESRTMLGLIGGMSGAEIEANALWEVTDWLRRNNNASHYEKEDYMQELLNKMVKCVHAGIVPPDDASQTIHGCASLLELKLANELPNATIILTNMLKTTTTTDIKRVFGFKFGPIEDAAVASGEKGFGLVRFKNPKAAMRAMEQFMTSEVVVNNVAIQLELLA